MRVCFSFDRCLLPLLTFTQRPTGSLQYRLDRFEKPQKEILERRQRAYRRQECIASSLPDAEVTEDVARAISEGSQKDLEELGTPPQTVVAPAEGANHVEVAPPV